MKLIITVLMLLSVSCSSYNARQDASVNPADCAKQCQIQGRQESFNPTSGVCECDEF